MSEEKRGLGDIIFEAVKETFSPDPGEDYGDVVRETVEDLPGVGDDESDTVTNESSVDEAETKVVEVESTDAVESESDPTNPTV